MNVCTVHTRISNWQTHLSSVTGVMERGPTEIVDGIDIRSTHQPAEKRRGWREEGERERGEWREEGEREGGRRQGGRERGREREGEGEGEGEERGGGRGGGRENSEK